MQIYSENPGPAFAIFKCLQFLASGLAFVYSYHFGLNIQVAILTSICILSALFFARIDLQYKKRLHSKT